MAGDQLGTTASKLNAQRQQAIINAVMAQGKTPAGAYAASHQDPGAGAGILPAHRAQSFQGIGWASSYSRAWGR